MTTRDIGVFCGTFNPIHWGHLLMAEIARDQIGMDKVLFITSPNPPHRKTDLLDAAARHDLVKVAVFDNPKFEASKIELEREGPSYTIDTLKELKQKFGEEARLNLIIGEDNLRFISQWHKADEIFGLCRLVVAPRVIQETPLEKPPPPDVEIITLDVPYAPISGSVIRDRLRNGRSVLYMVPINVDKLLREKRLYL